MQIDVEEDKEYAAQKKEEQSLQRKRKANILNVQAQDNDLELPDDSTVYDTSSFDSLEPTKIDLPGLKKLPPRKVKGEVSGEDALTSGRFGGIRRPKVGGFTGYSNSPETERTGCGTIVLRVVIELRQLQNGKCLLGN